MSCCLINVSERDSSTGSTAEINYYGFRVLNDTSLELTISETGDNVDTSIYDTGEINLKGINYSLEDGNLIIN